MTTAPSLEVSDSVSESNLNSFIHQVLAQAQQPQKLSQILASIPKGVRPSSEKLQNCLDAAIAAGTIHKFPPLKKQFCFWDRSPSEFAKTALVERLAYSRTKSEVVGTVCRLALMKGVSKQLVGRLLDELVEARTIRKIPSYLGGRTPRFTARELDPSDYVNNAIEKLADKLGMGRTELYRCANRVLLEIESTSTFIESQGNAAGSIGISTSAKSVDQKEDYDEEIGERLIQAMRDVNPHVVEGDMVSIKELRNFLDFKINKQSFDRHLIGLAKRSRVCLHPFDQPGLTSTEELEQFVVDDAGQYFNTVSLRNPR